MCSIGKGRFAAVARLLRRPSLDVDAVLAESAQADRRIRSGQTGRLRRAKMKGGVYGVKDRFHTLRGRLGTDGHKCQTYGRAGQQHGE
jgi:hypothetical protein